MLSTEGFCSVGAEDSSDKSSAVYYYDALKYPCPPNLSIWWNMGSMLFLILGAQILTGILLTMNYTADEQLAVMSVDYIMRDANYGWIIRSLHMGGASMFFALIYMHIARGVYFGAYLKNPHVWYSGLTLYLLSMGVGFLGYVLPWGVMSYWGLTVITNMMTVIPGGARALDWFQGGFVITTVTLKRVFVLHFLLPFVILGFSLAHVLLLHMNGSSNPLGLDETNFSVPFHPYYSIKDLAGFALLLAGLVGMTFTFASLTADPLQWQPINKMKTPAVIKPEWYFLYAYAILRSIPHKAGGVFTMFAAIVGIAVFPMISGSEKFQSMKVCPPARLMFVIWAANFMFLTVIGAQEPAGGWVLAGQFGTILHLSMLVMIPMIKAEWESWLYAYIQPEKKDLVMSV
uniref:Cytochrome b n=1 Tax=Magallana hongkongensis TaxID=2653900 RepID=B6RQ74_MAGHO|nr:cytochrome b [Crassostrea hongkongensis]ABY26708.1 cytochrome b [Crassostrea hongkongensis]ACD35450.1 cytochrome b [Crassostrea hongkongensis]ACL80178.1 cytochrome b [Crassostrea hongkongensis]ACL80190.1 cytochrome b [Crassostrea hongkongensis]ACO40169.1 cytochrome b [Crassostrea hongkongensis]